MALGLVALIAVIAIGISQAPHSSTHEPPAPTLAQAQADLRGSPPALASLHAQADALLGGGVKAVRARLAALRGYRVVINYWGSWCPPCQGEFPIFERVSAHDGRRIAFLAIDSHDEAGPARSFLSRHPVTYPSYTDPSGSVLTALGLAVGLPATAFYTPSGKMFVYQGAFESDAALEQAIRLYT
jgi:thiol-disulfide isomerase/thioredoxin